MLSDQELINNEHGIYEGKRWEAVFDKSVHFFTAKNEAEAKRIARAYGHRIAKQRFLAISEAMEGN